MDEEQGSEARIARSLLTFLLFVDVNCIFIGILYQECRLIAHPGKWRKIQVSIL